MVITGARLHECTLYLCIHHSFGNQSAASLSQQTSCTRSDRSSLRKREAYGVIKCSIARRPLTSVDGRLLEGNSEAGSHIQIKA